MKVAIDFVRFTTNSSATYTTKEGTFPITSAEVRVTNLGTGKVRQLGLYASEAPFEALPGEYGLNLWDPEMSSVLAPGESKIVSVMAPESLPATWRVRFQFSKLDWRDRLLLLPAWGLDIVQRFAPEGWLWDIPSEGFHSDWICPDGGAQ
jgi:hypothetical protein